MIFVHPRIHHIFNKKYKRIEIIFMCMIFELYTTKKARSLELKLHISAPYRDGSFYFIRVTSNKHMMMNRTNKHNHRDNIV
jgi:hypothetical protein